MVPERRRRRRTALRQRAFHAHSHGYGPGGAATYPLTGDIPISIRGNVPAIGGTRFYSVRYRNAISFCTSSPFNVTNGLIVTWRL